MTLEKHLTARLEGLRTCRVLHDVLLPQYLLYDPQLEIGAENLVRHEKIYCHLKFLTQGWVSLLLLTPPPDTRISRAATAGITVYPKSFAPAAATQ